MQKRNLYLGILWFATILVILYLIFSWDTSVILFNGNKWVFFITILLLLWLGDGFQYSHYMKKRLNYQFSFIAVLSDFIILLFGVSFGLTAFLIINLINSLIIGEDKKTKNELKSPTNHFVFTSVAIKAFVIVVTYILLGGGFGSEFNIYDLPFYIIALLVGQLVGYTLNYLYITYSFKSSTLRWRDNLNRINLRLFFVSVMDTVVVFVLVYLIKETILELRVEGSFGIYLYLYIIVQLLAIYIAYLTLTKFEFISSSRKISNLRRVITNSLLLSVGLKDSYTLEHSKRVAKYAVMFSHELGVKKSQLMNIEVASLLHDIGKLYVDQMILDSKEKLTEKEWIEVKKHSGKSLEVFEKMVEGTFYSIDMLQLIFSIAKHHHERYDGLGYPDGLRGEEIPYVARLITVVDAFDAMTHRRHYAKTKTLEEAKEELLNCSGTQFDPDIVNKFLEFLKPFDTVDSILENEFEIDIDNIVYRQRYFNLL